MDKQLFQHRIRWQFSSAWTWRLPIAFIFLIAIRSFLISDSMATLGAISEPPSVLNWALASLIGFVASAFFLYLILSLSEGSVTMNNNTRNFAKLSIKSYKHFLKEHRLNLLPVILILYGISISCSYLLGITPYLFFLLVSGGGILYYSALWIHYFLTDFYRLFRAYLSYFYPSVLFTIMLAFVLARNPQIDSLFIDLISDGGNMLLFLILFSGSIIAIWLTPSYLFFTDSFCVPINKKNNSEEVEQEEKPHLSIVIVLFLLRLLPSSLLTFLIGIVQKEPLKRNYFELIWRHKYKVEQKINQKIAYTLEPQGFALLRLLIGVMYVTTMGTVLIFAQNKAYVDDQRTWTNWYWGVGVLLLPVLALWLRNRWVRSLKASTSNTEAISIAKKIASRIVMHWKLAYWTLVVGYLAVLIAACFTDQDGAEFPVVASSIFAFFVLLSVWALIEMGYLLPPIKVFLQKYLIQKEEGKGNSLVCELKTDPNYRSLKGYYRSFLTISLSSLVSIGLLALLAFLICLFFPFSSLMPVLTKVNPINIYLLFSTGAIAIIVMIDRYVSIRRKLEEATDKDNNATKAKLHPYTAWVWASAGILLALAIVINRQGNDYHTVSYVPSTEINELSLQDYQELFLAKKDMADQEPIIFVAADGGGLKAAYWTMLTLWQLDSMGLMDRVFLMSGASGGAIGQGIYSYLLALDLDIHLKDSIIKELGATNFVSGDLTGALTRWPMNYVPNIGEKIMLRQDRMEAMSEHYFHVIHSILPDSIQERTRNFCYDTLRKKPYHYLWAEKNYELPLVITNTARSHDGIKAWAHPLKQDSFITAGVEDLTTVRLKTKDTFKDTLTYLPFPDALFLANRFPIMSPAAKIHGKGHFIDAGAVDNSGLGTIIQFLLKMKALDQDSSSVFFKHPIHIVSIKHDQSRFIKSQFDTLLNDKFGKTKQASEMAIFFSSIMNQGLVGNPSVFETQVADGEIEKIINAEIYTVDLPFRLQREDIENTYKREILDDSLSSKISKINRLIREEMKEVTSSAIVEPPLGRFLSGPERAYMKAMINYPDNKAVFDTLQWPRANTEYEK